MCGTVISALLLVGLPGLALSCGCGNAQLPQDPFDPLGPWHQRHLDCGIPPFAYRLPQDAQAKIHAIWIKYEAGDDCEAEQAATRDVIFSIPDEDRFRAFKGVCGPGFLANEPEAVRDAFHAVWFNEVLDIGAKQAEFRKLATQHLSGKAAEKFEAFMKSLDEAKHHREETISGFSPAAREAYQKWNTMRKEERQFLTGLPYDVRAELGLVCKCCAGCKAEKETKSVGRARRSVSASVDALVGALARADAQMLHEAAGAECTFVY